MQILGTTVGRGPEAATAANTAEMLRLLAAILKQLEYQSSLMHARLR